MSNISSQTIPFMEGDYRIGVSHKMIYDVARNKFYDRTLKECKNKICAEVGFGTGILTSIALQHGAKHIYAYERDPDIFRLGSEILKNMGLLNRVTLINDDYSPMDEELVFHEIVDRAIWGEGIINVVHLAQKHKVKMLPNNVSCNIHMCKNIALNKEKYKFEFTGVDSIDKKYNNAFKKSITSNNHICYHNVDKHALKSDIILGHYSYDLNTDKIPEYIETDITISDDCFIWCEYFMSDMRLMDGHWRADKILHKLTSGSFTFVQNTKDGSWWLE